MDTALQGPGSHHRAGQSIDAADRQNDGVEIGQLAFVVVVILLERSFRLLEIHWPRLVAHLPGYLVGTLGAYWTIQRLAILFRGLA